ncbi:MAG: trans-sulfuration enzyme family protein [bacterium]
MSDNKNYRPATLAIHAGQKPEPITGAVMPPVFMTSTYVQPSPGEHTGYEYTRTQNPTREAYEACVAGLEGGTKAFAFASGMAAVATILELLDHGDEVLAMDDLYGGTFRLFTKVRERSAGLQFNFVDLSQTNQIEQAITNKTKMIWIETPTNPMLKLADIKAVTDLAKKYDIISVVDNTFASPVLQNPLNMGADIVMHSATKYLNGHSDVVGGIAVVGDNPDLIEKMGFLQNSAGAVASPMDSFMILRGLKTLNIRVQRTCENALDLAQWLEQHPAIEKVIYPGLPSHPQYELAQTQMRAGGGIISIVIKGGLEPSRRFLEKCHLFALAESLGGVESLIEHPAIMTHASIPADIRQKLGIHDGLVRLSVGIEDVEDLREDLAQALS